ncbi:MAG: hypothetical protein A2233_03900 [Candidatus Kerfeldbacteria bacterium RIFOXYA2_FULL_38_24]|uniref:HD/PDEase domain-containing protein n=1 Tax=Candidatus Kerfeldbacteria bacterium RIFOXYB2_FULL_38_14 TaxID=1798547 RepID=A0A1G2BG09_9BACT|nr:MAG: hypothetical protein A2233_03900 [Candidatus Kerfeldbacteria bacterium RIFOXYA2_FULL_38_24]OGY87210.1 MAG: hypothetical protein A2319_01020 [Candidatus Kerfeldbacteria bacterium RIFOXYB2_FULL_38_14]OGY88476.1 MAG: hypothetical protein A2458_01730 [Candidatus Kerfeldbacteria bacterium RIFOXYC2_FULL_38_9]
MQYQDKIYGQFKINDAVIIELIKSEPMQRLKKINQYGASFYRFPHLTTTRFEHSVGVYYILRLLNASLEEQVAGLLHDVPHTAFSHVADNVFEDASQTFHEQFQEKVIFESNIPQILKKHDLSVWNLFKKSSFHLAERDLPDLCADRVDYFFRDCVTDKQLDLLDARKILEDMTIFDGDIVFKNKEYAVQFAQTFRNANEKLWANPLQSALYYLLAAAMKAALEDGVISFDDLFTTDKEVYDRMKASGNQEILRFLDDMDHVVVEENAKDFDYHVMPKARVVDPYILVQKDKAQQKVRLSSVDEKLKTKNQEIVERFKKGYYIKINRE